MKKIRVAIIEDEYPAARLLSEMIRDIRPEWQVEILPGSIEEAVSWFGKNEHPDLIFLDIRLNDGNSFVFIEKARPESTIVFTTAYDEYAVRAFTVNSIDYLLKPVHKERLEESIRKFERLAMLSSGNSERLFNIEQMLKAFGDNREKQYRTRFLISVGGHFYTIQTDDIAYFFSEGKTTYAVTDDRKTHLIETPLSKLEEQLDSRYFFRVNRQFILSAKSIRHIQNYFGGKAIVEVNPPHDGKILVSRDKVPMLKIWLNNG